MQLIKRLYEPDVAILPIGGHFTMDPREAAVALEFLGAKKCIPCHYGTFPLLAGTPDQLRELAPSGSRDRRDASPERRSKFETALVRRDQAAGASARRRG